jgi:ADP-heptose:LPS heptosyltransferase
MTILKKIENLNRLFIYNLISKYHKFKTNRQSSQVKYDKFLIFRYDAIGDMIVTTPVFSYLKSLYPSAQIDILASNRNDSIVKNDSRLKNIWTLPSNFIDKIKLMKQMKKENYDFILCFILHKTGNAAFYANLITNTNTRIVAMKHSDENRNKLYSGMFDIQVDTEDIRDKMTMAELQVKIVARALYLDENIAMTELKLYLSEINIEYVKSFLSKKHIVQQFIVLNVSSGNSYRTWSIEKNQEFLNQILKNDSELIVVLSYSPDDNDKAEQIASINK